MIVNEARNRQRPAWCWPKFAAVELTAPGWGVLCILLHCHEGTKTNGPQRHRGHKDKDTKARIRGVATVRPRAACCAGRPESAPFVPFVPLWVVLFLQDDGQAPVNGAGASGV